MCHREGSPRVKKSGVEFIHDAREQPWGQRVMRFYDPDGHIVEVGEPMEVVVVRYNSEGMGIEEIATRISLTADFIREVLLSA